MMRSLHLLAVFTLLAANLTTPPSSLAQNGSPAAGAPIRKRVGAPLEIKHEPLKAFPTDLKIPFPPDARFMNGYRSQYSSTKLITELRFQTANNHLKISDWYQKSLQGSGWNVTLGKPSAQGSSLTAFKQGLYCMMNFRSSGVSDTTNPSASVAPRGSSSTVMLNYSETR